MKLIITLLGLMICIDTLYAGNPDRAGESGAPELVINPWGRSNGFHGMYSSRVRGLEAMNLNVAGLSFVTKTEVAASRTELLRGSGVSLTAFGIGQAFGKHKENVVGVTFVGLDFGKIERTLVNNPTNGNGTFDPNFTNIAVAYTRSFSKAIRAGVLFRFINERIDELSASGAAIDAGIQYITGKRENMHFGISLRNVGTPMKFGGNGLTFRGEAPGDIDFQMTQEQRAEDFQLPTQLHIGLGYDILMGPNKEINKHLHRTTITANFTSNAFGEDHIGGGIEYAYKEMFMVRTGYRYEDGILKDSERTNAHTGLGAGLTVKVPLSKKKYEGPMLSIDYSYLTSSPFNGTHSFGFRVEL